MKEFKKQKKNDNLIGTSILIERKQKAFIERNNLNLSAMVRSLIEDLIRQDEENQKEIFKKAE